MSGNRDPVTGMSRDIINEIILGYRPHVDLREKYRDRAFETKIYHNKEGDDND